MRGYGERGDYETGESAIGLGKGTGSCKMKDCTLYY